MSELDSTPAKIWRPQAMFAHELTSTEQLERLNAEGGIAVSFRPNLRVRTHVRIEGSQSKTLSAWNTHSRSGFLTVPKIETDVLTIRFVTEGSMVRRNHAKHYVGRPGRAMLVAYGEMANEEASSGFSAVSGTITRDALIAGHRALAGEDAGPPPSFEPLVDVDRLPMRAFMQSFAAVQRALRGGVSEDDLAFPLLEELMVYQLLSSWPRIGPAGREANVRPAASPGVRLAMDYIDANLSRKLTLNEAAQAAGVGVRSLQIAFRREVGCTPLQYILAQRLDRAHADLTLVEDGLATVGSIAYRWGFNHMSDFSRRFRERFGYNPKDALGHRSHRGRKF